MRKTLIVFFVLLTQIVYVPFTFGAEFVNVKTFGAFGNDSEDDTIAIQKAINSVNGKDSTVVFFPAGKYVIKNGLIPKSNIIFEGDGGTSVLQFSAPPYSKSKKLFFGWHFTNQKNVGFHKLSMNGGARNYNSNPVDVDGAYHLIYFNPVDDYAVENIKISECKFSNSFDSAIQSYGSSAQKYPHPITKYVRIDNCTFTSTGAHGVGMNEWVNSSVSNSKFINIGMKIMIKGYGSGMAVDVSAGSEDVVVSGNSVSGAGGGFKTETHVNGGRKIISKNVVIENNRIENLYEGEGYVVWYGIRVNGENVTVKDNIISSYMHGILLSGDAYHVIVSGNTISKTKHKTAAGIRLDKNRGNHLISNNKIMNSAAQGILVSGTDIIITSNTISNSGLQGIRIADADNVVCDNNTFINNGAQDIAVAPINAHANNITIKNNHVNKGIYIDKAKTSNVISIGNY